MYKLKQIPEDFVVIEVSSVTVSDHGRYLYFWMKKKGLNTLDAVKELARQLRIKEKDIGFAGSKDKHAVTEQMISIAGVNKEAVEKVSFEKISLEFYGFGNKPISLGDLQGNKFEIVLRNLENETIEKTSLIENYFDEQRFSENNVRIGRYLLKKNFAAAAEVVDDLNLKRYL